jgi:D-alanine-D-alanine ligase
VTARAGSSPATTPGSSAPAVSSARRLRVAVLYGGRSAEHEISLLSARFVVESLDRRRFEPVLIGIDKDGRWSLQDEAALLAAPRDPRLVALGASMPAAALPAWPAGGLEIASAGAAPRKLDVDVVFPVLHGPMGEDGTVQGLLALAGVPHVGAGVLGSAVGMDKDVMKRLLAADGIPIVPHRVVRAADWARSRGSLAAEVERATGLPAFVKPANLGSSVGVSRATDAASLAAAIDEAFAWDDKAIVERGVPGVRELECAVIGNDDPIASCVGEIVVTHRDGFYSYDAKYVDAEGSETRIPADVPETVSSRLRELAIRTFQALGCEGLARVDAFLAPDGSVYVNEINTMPGFTAISMFPKLWEASGIRAEELVARLVDLALERAARRARLRTSV